MILAAYLTLSRPERLSVELTRITRALVQTTDPSERQRLNAEQERMAGALQKEIDKLAEPNNGTHRHHQSRRPRLCLCPRCSPWVGTPEAGTPED